MAHQLYRLDGPELHRRLDAKRNQEGISWRELGRRVGVSFTTFSRLQRSDITISGDSLVTMLVWLDMDNEIAYLIRPREEQS